MTDRNGTTHTYAYDALGRLTSDTITTLGSGVDGSIMQLGYTFNSQGLPYQQTSYSDTSGTNVVNQVEDVYNGLGQLTGEYQEHSGAVVATSSAEVTYAYTEMASGVNNSRMTSMTYPDGRIVHYGYNTGIDDAISRLSYTADDNGSGSAGVHLEDDQYLGLDTVVVRAHPQDGVDMSLIKQPSDTLASSDGGDQYTGLDRFGRVIDQNWITNDGSTNAASVDRYQYGYDADGNVTSKANDVKSIFSETYTYDTLNQLTGFNRSGAASQTYNMDALGNRTSVATTNADTVGGSVTNDYTTNAQNQIESMTDASGTNTASLGYDNDGNTLADDAGNTYTYDAWNRQATVSTSIQSGSNTVTVGETYGYDANGKRITSYVTGSAASGNTADNLYFSDQWQIVQETLVNTVGSGTNAVTTTTRNEYAWASGVYVNALIERDQTQTISPTGATNGLYASYFGAGSPDSLPIHETDSNINFDWSSTGPAALPSQGTNAFYVRWTGEVDAASAGAYTFNLGTGGDVEVKIDGKVVILLLDNPAGDIDGNGVNSLDDLNIFSANFGKIVPPGTGGDFNDNGTVDLGDLNTFSSGSGRGSPQWTTSTASITLSAGEHNIEIDYFQPQGLSAGEAGITLSWVTPSNTNSVTIPTASFTPQQSSTRLYAMQDANFNVTGFLDVNGNVVGRVVYTPYGQATVLNADWSPSTATFGNDAIGWTIGFQGGYTDPLSGLVHFQERDENVRTGTWMEVDPIGYTDGGDMYLMEHGEPTSGTDALGLRFQILEAGTGTDGEKPTNQGFVNAYKKVCEDALTFLDAHNEGYFKLAQKDGGVWWGSQEFHGTLKEFKDRIRLEATSSLTFDQTSATIDAFAVNAKSTNAKFIKQPWDQLAVFFHSEYTLGTTDPNGKSRLNSADVDENDLLKALKAAVPGAVVATCFQGGSHLTARLGFLGHAGLVGITKGKDGLPVGPIEVGRVGTCRIEFDPAQLQKVSGGPITTQPVTPGH